MVIDRRFPFWLSSYLVRNRIYTRPRSFLPFRATIRETSIIVDDPTKTKDEIPVTLKISVYNISCDFLGMDIQDDLGRHEVDVRQHTQKHRINGDRGCFLVFDFRINKVRSWNYVFLNFECEIVPRGKEIFFSCYLDWFPNRVYSWFFLNIFICCILWDSLVSIFLRYLLLAILFLFSEKDLNYLQLSSRFTYELKENYLTSFFLNKSQHHCLSFKNRIDVCPFLPDDVEAIYIVKYNLYKAWILIHD